MKKISKDKAWLGIWLGGIVVLLLWDLLFLNKPALKQVMAGFFNTFFIAVMVIAFTLGFAWVVVNLLHFLNVRKNRVGLVAANFCLNLIRSVPQIVGVLFGYVLISTLMQMGVLNGSFFVFILMAAIMSVCVFIEVVDLMRERIEHYRASDFYHAMLVCGIPEGRIVNFDILWKLSRIHIFNKLISVFGIAVFLQCSVDFIISVGLSTDVNAVNLPLTLGSLLAKIDSKQDILVIGSAITNWSYIPSLFFAHLQGVTVAFAIVFTLVCIYKISNGFAERNRL
jgi:hypothetical protein